MRLSQKHIVFFISAALVIATLVAYEPIRHNGFVNYDDNGYITENPNVKGGITQQSIKWAFTKPYAANWHPLTWLSHMLDCELFGLHPLGHHSVSVLIHIVNALLLFWILNSITGSMWASAFIAAVFALHPLQVESVAWAAERKTVLSGLFWLLTTAAYIHYARKPTGSRYLLVFLIFGLCIMTKPVVVTLPLVLLLLDYWPLDRVRRGQIGRLIVEKIPLLVLSGLLSVLTFKAQQGAGTVISLESIPLGYRISNIFVSYISYIGKMIVPRGLAIFYQSSHTIFPKTEGWFCAILFFLISFLCIYMSRRRKYTAVGWLWYVGTLVPMIGLVQCGFQDMANRYMYLSMLGLLFIIGWAVKEFVEKRQRLRTAAILSAAILLTVLVVLTRMQVKHWQNSLTLFEYGLETTTDNTTIETNYGIALFYEAGRLDEAASHLSKAVRLSPTFAKARNNLGKVFLKQGKANEAVECFNELIQQKQDSAEVHYNLAIGLGMQNKYEEAIKQLSKTLEMDSDYPDAQNRIGIALMAIGKPDEAIWHFDQALRTDKDKSEVYGNLGTAYMRLGKYGPGIYNFNKAVENKPDSIVNLNCLAWALATVEDTSLRDVNRAIEAAGRVCELTDNNNAEYLDTLAITYAAAGRFEEAKATAGKALIIAKANKQEALAGEIKERIKLYEGGQPYRRK